MQTVVQRGELVYVRNGRTFKSLPMAVAGNAEAEEAARRYSRELASGRRWSYWYFPSVATLLAGLATSGFLSDTPDSWEKDSLSKGLLVTGLGMSVLWIIGLKKRRNAQAHIYDAINIYNEGVSLPVSPSPPEAGK